MLNQFDSYLTVPYVDGGRSMAGFDCWGLVRDILHRHYNHPLLESFGHIAADDKQRLTGAYHQVQHKFLPSTAKDGCIAACFKRGLLLHVGVVVEQNGLHIYHTGRKHGPLKARLEAFESLFFRVEYYAYNPRFSEQARP